MKKTNPEEKKLIKDAIKMGDINHLPEIIQILHHTNAIYEVRKKLEEHITKINFILDKFNKSKTSDELRTLAASIAKRKN